MSAKKKTLSQFVLGNGPMPHKMGVLSGVGTSYFFRVNLKERGRISGEEFTAKEKDADFYSIRNGSSLGVKNVICYYHGNPNGTFPVLITDKQFNPLYVEKGYLNKISGLEIPKEF